jgi:DNA-binding NarL/FixJ family response regulator
MKDAIRVFIVDDHALIREGLKNLLREESDIVVVGEASDGTDLSSLLHKKPCDIVVLDISLSGKSGLDLITEIREQHPQTRILILTMHPEERFAARAFKMGAAGYITKESVPRDLVSAIRKVMAGGVFVNPRFAEIIAAELRSGTPGKPHELLSGREFEIFLLIAGGRKVDEIAHDLCLAKGTVYTYRSRVLEKMRMSTDTELTRYAIENGLIP